MAEEKTSIEKAIRTSAFSSYCQGKYGGNIRLPIDPAQITKDLGREVTHGTSNSCNSEFSDNTVWANLGLLKEDSQFTTAHGLGHFMLKPGEHETENSHALNITCAESNETEANRFALELLIPAITLRNIAIKFHEADPVVLPWIFGVNAGLVKHRMQGLGLTV